ncbi:MAG: glycoside hydrolase family 3 N-terminal domain-containing protein [Candidatus Izemoplasmatales bacterium]
MIKDLMSKLSRKEKIGQLLQIAPFFFIKDLKVEVFGHVRHLDLNEEKIFMAGSVLGIGSAEEMIAVQKSYLEKSPNKIPLLFMADIIHGYKTIFPVPIALGSSFNPDLAYLCASVSASEASTAGIQVTFSPMADLGRDPRWGRVVEGFGEDPYLTSLMAEAMVKGYTKNGIEYEGNLASCVKHFAGYGAAEAGRDYNTVDLSRTALYNEYLPAYKKALDAGARLIMTAFNTIDRIPSTINSFLLRDVLRKEWGSDVVTISDYDSLKQILAHGVADNMKDVAYLGITGGLDIEMASTAYTNHLEKLIEEGKVPESLLDDACERVLTLKKDLGLFENPYKNANPEKEKTDVLTKENLDASLEAARESLVLLENDGILPLDKNVKIALIGPYSVSKSVIGPWSWHGRRDLHDSLSDTLLSNIVYQNDSVLLSDYTESEIAKIKEADVIVLAIGEVDWQSGEAHSRSDLSLPNNQDDLLKLGELSGKKVVTILYNGRPLLLNKIKESNALIESWFLGSMASQAIKEVLFGETNPSGKLPMSFPRNTGQIPVYYNHLNTGRPYLGEFDHNEYVSKYLDVENTPLYAFGYGKSYSHFIYQNLTLSTNKLKCGDTLTVTVEVHNDSLISGKETVFLFIRDKVARISRPVQELKKFQKIEIEASSSKVVTFELSLSDLSYYLHDGSFVYDLGDFEVMVGPSSMDVMRQEFVLL